MSIEGEVKWFLEDTHAALKYSENPEGLFIDTIWVPAAYRNKGIGSKLIIHFLALADAMGKKVKVKARPLGNFSEERLNRLISYYHRFGFQLVERGSTVAFMVREGKVIDFPSSQDLPSTASCQLVSSN